MRPWLNWIEHLTTDQKVEGSNPSGRARILTAGNGGLIFVQAQDLNPRVRQQVDLPNAGAGKSSRLPHSRHVCVVRGNPSGRARILTAGNGGLIFVQAQDLNPRVRQQVDLPNAGAGKSSRLPRSRHVCVARGNPLSAPGLTCGFPRDFYFIK